MTVVPGWDEATVEAARAAGVDIEWAAGVGRERVLAQERASLLRERDAAIEANRAESAALQEAVRLYTEDGVSGAEIAVALEQHVGRAAATAFVEQVWAPTEEPVYVEEATPSDWRQATAMADQQRAAYAEQLAQGQHEAERAELERRGQAAEALLHSLPHGRELEQEVLAAVRAVDPEIVRANPEAATLAAYKVAKTQLDVAGDALHHAVEAQPFRSTEFDGAWKAGLEGKDVPPRDRHELERQRQAQLVERAAAMNERDAGAEVGRRLEPQKTDVDLQREALQMVERANGRNHFGDAFVKTGGEGKHRDPAAVDKTFGGSVERNRSFAETSKTNEIAARGRDHHFPGAGTDRYPSFNERAADEQRRKEAFTEAQKEVTR